MPIIDLYRYSQNPSPEQLTQVCGDLLSQLKLTDGKPVIEDFLASAEVLAEQIIGHYDSLPAVAKELSGLTQHGMKLPVAVMQVFLFACVREHESLGCMIAQVNDLYGDKTDQLGCSAMAGMLQDASLMLVPRPSLWAKDGKLNHDPIAFCAMHSITYIREVSDYFAQGEAGVSKLLADYVHMSEASREMLDRDLRKRVYRSMLPDDDPVRWLLRDKLSDIEDGLVRFEKLFQCVDLDDDPEGFEVGFEEQFEHAFTLVESMPVEDARQVLLAISGCIADWMADQSGYVRNLAVPELVVPRLVRVLERARPLGFEGMPEVYSHTLSSTKNSPKQFVAYVLEGGMRSEWEGLDTVSAWAEAAVIACEEKNLLSLGLEEKHLGILANRKGTPGLREALMKTKTGAEILLYQDLGL